MKKQWGLSQDEFDRLLAWLSPEREQAGAKYESIRSGLIELFDSWKCCEHEALADETINRVVAKVDSIAPHYSGDPALYFYGVAKNVRHEYLRKRQDLPLLVDCKLPAVSQSNEKEQLSACLDQCLNELPAPDKDLVLMYYQGDKKARIEARKRLVEQMSVTSNALRVRLFRIRSTLEECIAHCVEAAERGNKSS
jgi:RNA polymerase sigma factor (sigma-70 family)